MNIEQFFSLNFIEEYFEANLAPLHLGFSTGDNEMTMVFIGR